MRKSDQIDLVAKALVAAQSEMGNAVKDSKNPFFKSKYADINSIREAALPVLAKHKLAVLQPPEHIDGKNFIETIVIHESGQFLSSLNEVIVGKQNDPQSYLAAQTYTRRGALQAVLNMGSEDDDGNSISGRITEIKSTPISKPVAKVAEEIKEEVKTDTTPITEAPKKRFGGFASKAKPTGDVS